jgi:nucleoside 2-deoxyribosyltransferase
MKKLVYIAAPYTHPDPVENTHKAIQVAEELIKYGFVPYVPHVSLLWHLVAPHPVSFWYEYDLHILYRCDCLLRIGGASEGADNEVKYAQENSIPVFRSIQELKEYDWGRNGEE